MAVPGVDIYVIEDVAVALCVVFVNCDGFAYTLCEANTNNPITARMHKTAAKLWTNVCLFIITFIFSKRFSPQPGTHKDAREGDNPIELAKPDTSPLKMSLQGTNLSMRQSR